MGIGNKSDIYATELDTECGRKTHGISIAEAHGGAVNSAFEPRLCTSAAAALFCERKTQKSAMLRDDNLTGRIKIAVLGVW